MTADIRNVKNSQLVYQYSVALTHLLYLISTPPFFFFLIFILNVLHRQQRSCFESRLITVFETYKLITLCNNERVERSLTSL